ncbi:MAG: TonB family protein [Rhizobacter sp.]
MTMAATATLERDAFMPRRPAGLGSGLVLAIFAHLLLVAALTFSVNWHVSSPEGVEAELWAAVPQIAAPRPTQAEPPPPPPERVVKPLPKPEPVAKPPPKEEPAPDAQIAIEKAKRLEEKRKKELAEQAREEKEAKKEAEKLARQRKAEQAEKLAEQKRKEQAAETLKTELANKKREAAQAAALADAREKQMQRIASLAGATGAANATGTAAQNAGPSADYIGRIKGRIRPNVSFPDTLPGNPVVEIEITVAPDGRIMSSRIVKASGVPEWDDAVKRGIDKTAVLPRDETGRVTSPMIIQYKPRD